MLYTFFSVFDTGMPGVQYYLGMGAREEGLQRDDCGVQDGNSQSKCIN